MKAMNRSQNRFFSRLLPRVFLGAGLLLLGLLLTVYLTAIPLVESAMRSTEERAGLTVITNVTQLVDMGEEELRQYRMAAIEERKTKLKEVVALAEIVLRYEYAEKRKAGKPSRLALEESLNVIRQFRYGKDDYVWAFNDNSVLIAHPDPRLDKRDFAKVRDVKGKLIIPHMVEIGLDHGEGFSTYWWNRLGKTVPSQKLAYSLFLPDLDVHLSSGLYIDDIEELVAARKTTLMANLAKRIAQIRIAKQGYVYVFDGKYNMLFHPNIAGKNLLQTKNPVTGNLILDELMAVADKTDGLRYLWDKPGDEKHFVHRKISLVQYYPQNDWYIASSVYLDDLYESAEALTNRLLLFGFLSLVVTLVIVFLFVRRFTRPISHLAEVARQVESGNLEARSEILSHDEVGDLARAFNRMVKQISDHIQNLDAMIAKRTAEIEATNQSLLEVNAVIVQQVARVAHQQKMIVELSTRHAVQGGGLSEVVHFVTEQCAAVLDVERVSVWLFEDQSKVLRCYDLFLRSTQTRENGQVMTEAGYPREFSVLHGAKFVDAGDAQNDPRCAGYVAEHLKPNGIGALLDTLIQAGAIRFGVLRIEHVGPPRAWASDETAFASQVADQIAITLQNEQRQQDANQIRQLNIELEDRVAARTRELAESNKQLSGAVDTLQRAQDELVRTERLASLGAMVAGIAHELNTPLGNGLTVASTLQDEIVDIGTTIEGGQLRKTQLVGFMERSQQAIVLLMRSLNRAADLVTNFKQVAVDQTSAQRRQFDLGVIVRENIETLWPKYKHTAHRIEQSVPSGILMDSFPGPLGQVISNTIENAILHGFDEGVGGIVLISAQTLPDGLVRLSVTDNGKGIAPEIQTKIFDPFFTTRLGKGGSGLGLHIVFGLVSKTLGGRIAVSSEPGKGTCFTLDLPLVAPKNQEAAPK